MQNISSDLYHLGIVEVMSVYKYRDLDTDRRALDLERNTYFFILRVSRVRLDACDRDFIFSHREITSAVANCNEKPQPESWGTGGCGFRLRDGYATKYSRYEPSRRRSVSATTYAAAAKRTFGEPTTPLFSIAAFISSEANQMPCLCHVGD